jgi:hypothetical protein
LRPPHTSFEAVVERLATTALAGSRVTEVPLPEGVTWIVDLPAGDLVATWAQARDALAGLGLYPVAVARFGGGDWPEEDLFSRFYYGEDAAPETVIARSRELSVEDALGRYDWSHTSDADHWDEIVEVQLSLTARDYGSAPDPGDLADVAPGDEPGLERRLMEWEEAVRPTRDAPVTNESFAWFDPADGPGLALVPVADPCHALAYLSFYGAEGAGGHEALTRLACSWEERFGARLVANWGTMLQFLADRPAATLDDAFQLAVEHTRVAPSTTLLPGEGIRHLARHLWCGERWFLHERP